MDERRQYVRLTKRLHLYYRTPDDPETITQALAQDISAGGLFMICERAMNVNAELVVEVDLHDGPPREMAARVARYVEFEGGIFGLGLEFTQMPDDVRTSLDAFVDAQEDEPRQNVEAYLVVRASETPGD